MLLPEAKAARDFLVARPPFNLPFVKNTYEEIQAAGERRSDPAESRTRTAFPGFMSKDRRPERLFMSRLSSTLPTAAG